MVGTCIQQARCGLRKMLGGEGSRKQKTQVRSRSVSRGSPHALSSQSLGKLEGLGQVYGEGTHSAGKESVCNVGDLGSILGLGRFPAEENDYPLQYSGLENSMDCIVPGVAKSRTRLSGFHFYLLSKIITGEEQKQGQGT